MVCSDRVREFVSGQTECHDEREVKQQLERGRRAVALTWISTDHARETVAAVADGGWLGEVGHGLSLPCDNRPTMDRMWDDQDDEPELAGYQPHERPLRGRHFSTIMRVVVVLGLAGLVLPGILITLGTANRTATATCAAYTAFYAPEAVGYSTRFELVSPAGMGWNCYAIAFGGDELLLKSLGLIPGGVRLPQAPIENS